MKRWYEMGVRINVLISKEANKKLVEYQNYHLIGTKDETITKILLALEPSPKKPKN